MSKQWINVAALVGVAGILYLAITLGKYFHPFGSSDAGELVWIVVLGLLTLVATVGAGFIIWIRE